MGDGFRISVILNFFLRPVKFWQIFNPLFPPHEKHKQELASRLQKCVTCCCCYDTVRPLSIAQNLSALQLKQLSFNGTNLFLNQRNSMSDDSDDDSGPSSCMHGNTRGPFNCKSLSLEDKEKFKRKLMRLFQCQNGHLLCEICLSRLLADAKLRNVETKCPFCRIPLNFDRVSRNRVVEEIICLLQEGVKN